MKDIIDNTKAVTVCVAPKEGTIFYLEPYEDYTVADNVVKIRRHLSKEDVITLHYTTSTFTPRPKTRHTRNY